MEHTCAYCHTTSLEKPLIHAEIQGKDSYICVGCLPKVIHGK